MKKYSIWRRDKGGDWQKVPGEHATPSTAQQHMERWMQTYPGRDYAVLPKGESPCQKSN